MTVDLSHQRGSDLRLSATGDLLAVQAPDLGQQRVLRRLLTNPGDYIFHPDYGAGLARFIGQPVPATRLRAVIRRQMLLEAAVSQSPPPTVAVSAGADGTTVASIQYADAETGQTVTVPT